MMRPGRWSRACEGNPARQALEGKTKQGNQTTRRHSNHRLEGDDNSLGLIEIFLRHYTPSSGT